MAARVGRLPTAIGPQASLEASRPDRTDATPVYARRISGKEFDRQLEAA